METTITATFAVSQPVTLVARTSNEMEEMVEMFFANGALTVSIR